MEIFLIIRQNPGCETYPQELRFHWFSSRQVQLPHQRGVVSIEAEEYNNTWRDSTGEHKMAGHIRAKGRIRAK